MTSWSNLLKSLNDLKKLSSYARIKQPSTIGHNELWKKAKWSPDWNLRKAQTKQKHLLQLGVAMSWSYGYLDPSPN